MRLRLLALASGLVVALCALDRQDAFVGYREAKADGDAACTDTSDNCADWATRGECESNKAFMHVSCARACGTCSPPASGDASELPVDWSGDVVELRTSAGAIRIALLAAGAPRTTALVKSLAEEKGASCTNCRIYRSEALPKPGAVDNYGGPGPPYALIQGSFQSAVFTPVEKESAPLVKRGDACLIGVCPLAALRSQPHALAARLWARLFHRSRPARRVGKRAHRVGTRGGQHGRRGRNRRAACSGGDLGSDARYHSSRSAALHHQPKNERIVSNYNSVCEYGDRVGRSAVAARVRSIPRIAMRGARSRSQPCPRWHGGGGGGKKRNSSRTIDWRL